MSIRFENPWFLLFIPVVIGLLIFSMRYIYTRNTGLKIFQIITRFILALALIVALAQGTLRIVGKNVATIFLVDVSDSVREQREEVVDFVNEAIKNKKSKDSVGIIAFGGDTRVEQFISKKINFQGFQTDVTTQATDLEEAVNMALSQMPEDSAKRIVLITDGNENEGDLRETAEQVIASGCVFEVKKLQENISDEVYVSDMSIPEAVGMGENFNIRVEVESNVACPATVSLYSGRTLKGQQEVMLQKGTNQFVFRDTQTDEGLKTYRVVVEAEKDTVSVNNEFSAFTSIETELPLLVVEGKPMQGENLCRMMDGMGLKYDRVQPSTVPSTISEFTEYSAIIFVDVFADDLREGFMENLENYVKNYGGGFIATGGTNSFALGNYRDTPIETVLPVEMDLHGQNEIPSMAMAVIIDQSGSMSDGNGIITNLDLAKESAVAALNNLRDDDYFEVISFDDHYKRVVELQQASDKGSMENAIYDINIGGGTSIYPPLLAAATDLSANPAMIKHIILLTDGQDYFDDYKELEEKINDAGITLTCVSIGTNCNDLLLKDLAEKCGGRYFHTDINTDIPRIFAQEVFLSTNEYLINEEFIPVIKSNDVLIRDFANEGFPSLYGYIATTAKDRSIAVLDTHNGDPLLYYWQYGLGKTVAWSSDVTGEWSSNYSNWENFQAMWHNIIKYVTEDMAMEGAEVSVKQNGGKATVQYSTEDYDGNTTVTATIFDDTGKVTEIELDPKKPGSYEAQIETNSTGVYSINVVQKQGNDVVSSMNTAAIMQYSLEYRFYPDNTLLEEYVATVGGSFIDSAAEVFATEPVFVKNKFNLATGLLIFAAFFFLLDIAIRRFHIDFMSLAPVVAVRRKIDENRVKKQEEARIKELQRNKRRAEKSAQILTDLDAKGKEVKGSPLAEDVKETKKSKKSPEKKPKKEKVKDEAPVVTNLYARMNETRTYQSSNPTKPVSSSPNLSKPVSSLPNPSRPVSPLPNPAKAAGTAGTKPSGTPKPNLSGQPGKGSALHNTARPNSQPGASVVSQAKGGEGKQTRIWTREQ